MQTQIHKALMLGSAPMSLKELPLAPALISSVVKKRGYNFEFADINLRLYELCNQDYPTYQEKIELLQDIQNPVQDDPVIAVWEQEIQDQVSTTGYLIVNVFSHYSQSVALRIVELTRKTCPQITILMGGIGSQKYITGADNPTARRWIKSKFKNSQEIIFGQLLLNNNLIDSWQQDTTTSEIERMLPVRLSKNLSVADVDFEIYNLDGYQWEAHRSVPILGSYGCVRQCSFCDVIKHFPSYSFVEADQVSKQIVDVYKQTGISRFAFMDSLVNGSMKNFETLLANLAHSKSQQWLPESFGWSGTYICRPRSTQLDRIHGLLSGSGVDKLIIGVETGSDRVRFDMDKKFTNQDLLYELSAFKKFKVKTELLFFPAWPTETAVDFKHTLTLFQQLAEYAQTNVVETVNLGPNGFSLIDGTPIDRDKEKIGLESGPTPFLWKCKTNPELNFWETVRRRLLMAAVCEHHGLRLASENIFRRYLILNLNRYRDLILDYAGSLTHPINNFGDTMNSLPDQHQITLSVINSGQSAVVVNIQDQQYYCIPGISEIKFELTKPYSQALTVNFDFEFDKDYSPCWAQHTNGDYYSKTGIYLEKILVDHRDVTLWGFNIFTQQHLLTQHNLPTDYADHVNQRCVINNTRLQWNIPENTGLQSWILKKLLSEEYQERVSVDQRLDKELAWYCQN
jgi:hypothetical protein